MKKINCKDGLVNRQELDARKLRNILIRNDPAEINEIKKRLDIINEAYEKQFKEKALRNYSFFFLLIRDDPALYSAFKRFGNFQIVWEYIKSQKGKKVRY